MKKLLLFGLGIALIVPLVSSAATFKAGEFVEQKGTPVQDDIYLAGGSVDVSGDVNGDVTAAGGEVSIDGVISGDVLSSGGAVDILGEIGDDVRVGGGEVIFSGDVRDDFVAAAGYVRFSGDATVGGDAVIAAGAVLANGTISGDLTVYGGEAHLNGIVNGDVTLNFTEKVTIGEDTVIGGDLTYSALEEIEIPEGVLIGGEVKRVEGVIKDGDKHKLGALFGSFFIMKIISVLVAALVLVLLFPKLSQSFGEDGYNRFGKNALVGFVGMVVIPILAIGLMFTFVGMFAGVLAFAIGTTLLLIGKAYAGVLLGALLSKWIQKSVTVDWKWTIIGVVLLNLILLIPFIGFFAVLVIFLASFGTILMAVYNRVWKSR